MKINQLTKRLVEGGNIFKAPDYVKDTNPHMLTRDIKREEVPATVEYLEQLLDMPLKDNLMGSTGIAPTSGDMDIAIDANTISKEELFNYLVSAVDDPSYVKKAGISVHFMTPIQGDPDNGFVQTDFMFVPNLKFALWVNQSPRNSQYKGKHKQQLLADLTKTINPNWKWSNFTSGIVDRATDKSVFGYNPTKIAHALLGDSATPDDLNSVESILAKLKSNKHEIAARDAFKQTLARDQNGPQLAENFVDNKAVYAATKLRAVNDFERRHEFHNALNALERIRFLIPSQEYQSVKKRIESKNKLNLLKGQMKRDLKNKPRMYEAANPKVGREFQHLEDLVYTEGVEGVKRAVQRLLQIAKNSSELEVKWDGSPAILFGRDDTGKFHFGDKFAKQMLSTPEEVFAYYTRTSQTESRREFANSMAKLTKLYEAATPKDYVGFLEAGLLYRSKPELENGEYSFEPNTVRYYVSADSDLGHRIGKSITGCAATAYFDHLPALGGHRRPVGEMYKPMNSIPQVVVIPPKFAEGRAKLDVEELKSFYKYAVANKDALESFIAPESGFSDIRNIIYTYVNSQVDSDTLLADLGHNFADWVQTSGKVSAPKQAKILERLKTNAKGAQVLFELIRAIMIIKDDLIDNVESRTLGSLGMRAELGKFGQGGEGFVHDPDAGIGPTKLVKRGQFTAANRAKSRGEEPATLAEFAIDKSGDGDGRSRLIGSIMRLLKAGKKIDFFVPGIRGHVVGSGGNGDWLTLKRWNKPYSKINYSLALDSKDDDRFVLKMINPDYYQVVEKQNLAEAITRRDLLKGLAGAGTLGAASKASAIAGAFPSPSTREKWAKDAAASNAAEAKRQAEIKAKRDAERLRQGTQDIERLNKINFHGGKVTPANASWDGDSDFLDLDGTQYAMASRMPIRGDEPGNMKLISTKEGRQVYIWTRNSLKGVVGRYFYPAPAGSSQINEYAPTRAGGAGDDYLKTLASAWYNDTYNTGSLNKGIETQEDVERILANGIICNDGKKRKYSIGYNSGFDGVLITSEDWYEHSDQDDNGNYFDERTGKPWGPYEYIEFKGTQLYEQQNLAEARIISPNRTGQVIFRKNLNDKVVSLVADDVPQQLSDKVITAAMNKLRERGAVVNKNQFSWISGYPINKTTLGESIERTGHSDTAVVGWGRGMGHKGHMYLASAVITTAKELKADPYFVLSRTVGADDPITPQDKLHIYKKVFKNHQKIFQVATDEVPDLTRVLSMLDTLGYKNVVVIVGEDQKKAFQYLHNYNGKPNKQGEIPFKFDDLKVISRQETNDPYASEEGPRATPMRDVLSDPEEIEVQRRALYPSGIFGSKPIEDVSDSDVQFAVWRDAMPDVLSNIEVRALMKKAAKTMGVSIKEADQPSNASNNSPIPGTPADLQPQVSPEEQKKHDAELAILRRWMGHNTD